jgi:hypothetical protein
VSYHCSEHSCPTEDKIDDVKDSFHENWNVCLIHSLNTTRNFNGKVGREDIFKPTIGNESLYEISNDNEVRLVNSATSKNFRV